jgi:hypothetical protein
METTADSGSSLSSSYESDERQIEKPDAEGRPKNIFNDGLIQMNTVKKGEIKALSLIVTYPCVSVFICGLSLSSALAYSAVCSLLPFVYFAYFVVYNVFFPSVYSVVRILFIRLCVRVFRGCISFLFIPPLAVAPLFSVTSC